MVLSFNLVLMHCNLVNNVYQQESRVLFSFVPDKQFKQLIDVEPHLPIILKTLNAGFNCMEIWLQIKITFRWK